MFEGFQNGTLGRSVPRLFVFLRREKRAASGPVIRLTGNFLLNGNDP